MYERTNFFLAGVVMNSVQTVGQGELEDRRAPWSKKWGRLGAQWESMPMSLERDIPGANVVVVRTIHSVRRTGIRPYS